MATDSAIRSVSNTLSGTTADTVTLTQPWSAIEVTNSDTTNILWVRQDGVTAVAAADNATPIAPSSSKIISASVSTTGTHVISVVGNGGGYTIEGVN